MFGQMLAVGWMSRQTRPNVHAAGPAEMSVNPWLQATMIDQRVAVQRKDRSQVMLHSPAGQSRQSIGNAKHRNQALKPDALAVIPKHIDLALVLHFWQHTSWQALTCLLHDSGAGKAVSNSGSSARTTWAALGVRAPLCWGSGRPWGPAVTRMAVTDSSMRKFF